MAESAKISVLMVDDNAAMREAIARSLTRRGCRVTTAADGVQGLDALRSQPFDVVISDLNMPERGGLWLWRQALVLRPELRGRFVLIASEPLPEPRSMSFFMESERLLIKPLSLETLWRQVQDAMHGEHEVYSERLAQPPETPARTTSRVTQARRSL